MRKTKQLTLCAVLVALAMALSYTERFIPLQMVVPLPGVKLGLANIVTLFALLQLGAPAAFSVLIVRCLLGAMFAGNASALLFSLMGGVCAMLVMIALKRFRRLSVFGVSIGGAAAHNMGQIGAAIITLGDTAVLGYLPILLGVSLITGALTGFVTTLLLRAMQNIHLSHS